MKKRFLPALLALTLALPFPALAKETRAEFSDVSPEDWFAPYVEVCVKDGLLNGVGDGVFAPGQTLNGDEALVMAARVLLMANGETEFPKGPDAQGFWDWAGWNKGQYFPFGNSVAETQWYVDSWCWDPLIYLAQAGGPDLFPDSGITYSTDRQTFFKALAFAAQGLELPAINEVDAVPGTRDEAILGLYRAGILAGTDPYGSFGGQAPLTRAEAAAALARIARPELRMVFTLEPRNYPYTLTYLMDGESNAGLNYPLLAISGSTESDPSGLLSLDGTLHPWPGTTPSWGLERSGDYAWFSCWNEETEDDPYDQLQGLMDKNGEMVVPLGAYAMVRATQDGHFLVSDDEHGSSDAPWRLLNRDQTLAAELPAPASVLPEGATLSSSGPNWFDLNQGVMPYWDEESGLWGYVGMDGNWVVEPLWANASNFQRGYAVVENESGLWGCIDLAGNIVLPFQYAFLNPSRDSWDYEGPTVFAFQDQNGQTGLLTLGGETAYVSLKDENKRTRIFQNGYGLCYSGYDHAYYWYIDASGEPISEHFDWAGPIGPDRAGFVGLDGKIYRIQFQNAEFPASPAQPNSDPDSPRIYTLTDLPVGPGFSANDAYLPQAGYVTLSRQEGDVEQYAVLTSDGRFIDLGTDEPYSRGKGLLALQRKTNPYNWYGVMDLANEEMVLPFGAWGWERYTDCRFLQDGEHFITGDPEAYSCDIVWDREGNRVWSGGSSVESWWSRFHDGLRAQKWGESWGYVDVDNHIVIEPQWAACGDFQDSYAVVSPTPGMPGEYQLWGVIDTTGELVIPAEYHSLDNHGDGMFLYTMFTPGGEVAEQGMIRASDGKKFPGHKANNFLDFTNGYGTYMDFDKYTDPTGWRWVYVNTEMETVTQEFDWAGPIGPDGAGFVGLDGKIYRIQFADTPSTEL